MIKIERYDNVVLYLNEEKFALVRFDKKNRIIYVYDKTSTSSLSMVVSYHNVARVVFQASNEFLSYGD